MMLGFMSSPYSSTSFSLVRRQPRAIILIKGPPGNSPAFQRWGTDKKNKQAPFGAVENSFRPWRDSTVLITQPSVKTLGYCANVSAFAQRDQQNGNVSISDDRMRDAANDEFEHCSVAVRAHDNEIGGQPLCFLQNTLGGLPLN